MLAATAAWAALSLALPAGAGQLGFDSGNLGVAYTEQDSAWDVYFAVKFSNPMDAVPLVINAVEIFGGHPDLAGDLDVYVWDSDYDGKPGYETIVLYDQVLDPAQTWNRYEVREQASQEHIMPGCSIYAGFGLLEPTPCGAPYDDQTPGAGRSWWNHPYETWDWEQGGPAVAGGANLMVRLDVTPVNTWKGQTGDWLDPTQWWYGLPAAEQEVTVGGSGTAQVTTGEAEAARVILTCDLDHTGGTLAVGEELYVGYWTHSGAYTLSSGTLAVRDLYLGPYNYGTLTLAGDAEIYVSGKLHLGYRARLFVAGGTVHMTGAALENRCTDATAVPGLAALTVIFEGGAGQVDPVEVAGQDLGAAPAGWTANFALGTLQLGGADAGRIRLIDDYQNQPDWVQAEALYVEGLVLNAGAAIDLNGLNLYYRNGGDPKQLFRGDATLDGQVNYLDVGIVATNYGSAALTWAGGDFTGDQIVNYLDVGILATNYGNGGGSGGQVPEPAAIVLLVPMALTLLARRRR